MIIVKELAELIIRDETIHDGRPIISGTATTVRTIAIMYKQGLTPEEIAGELPLDLAQIYAAIAYYHLHTEDVEADIQSDSEAQLIAQYGDSVNAPFDPSLT